MRGFVAFVLGAFVGAIASWECARRKFQKIADDEIESVRVYYQEKSKSQDEQKTPETDATNPVEFEEYEKLVESYRDPKADKGPVVIDPSDYGMSTLCVTYTCYADGVVTDGQDDIVEDVESVLGTEWRRILENEDSVYVRNEARYCDYEIIVDRQTYAETHSAEDE